MVTGQGSENGAEGSRLVNDEREVATEIVPVPDKPPAGHVWRSATEMHEGREFRRRTGFDYEVMVKELVGAAEPLAGARVLNIATGTGFIARQLSARAGGRGKVIGIDADPGLVDQARLGAQSAGITLRTDWRVASADRLPFAENEFDVVTCGTAFHRLPVTEFLKEAQRVLKAGGRLVIADELKSPAGVLALWLAAQRGYDRIVHRDLADPNEQFFLAEEIVALVSDAGFSQIVVKGLQHRNRRGRVFSLVRAVK